MPKKTILIVLENYPYVGGVERTTTLLADKLYQEGWGVVVLAARGNKEVVEGFAVGQGIAVEHLPDDQQIQSDLNKEFVRQLIDHYGIGIIWNQGLSEAITRLTMPFAQSGIHYVVALHNSPDAFARSLAAEKSATNGGGVKQRIKRVLWPLYVRYRWAKIRQYYAWVYAHSDAFVLLSDAFKPDMMRLVNSSDGAKFTTITNPLANPAVFRAEELAEKKKQVLYVGRLDRVQKRVDRTVEVFRSISSRHPEWELVVVGDGPQRAELEAMAEGCGRIVVKGGVPDTEPYFRAASVLVLTSEFEGFGLVLTEAQQFGVVPMAFASYASVHDIIEDGVNGVLVEPFDTKAYAQRLEELIENEALRRTMAERGLETCEKFRLTYVLHQWTELFEQL